MATEMMTKDATVVYRISQHDPQQILWRKNISGLRYKKYKRYESAGEALAALYKLQRGDLPKD